MSSFVRSGYLTFSGALDRVASVLHIQKSEAQKTLRQLLYSGQVPSRIIERSGQKHDTPTHVWGGMKWDEALKSGAVCFEVAAYAPDAHGRIIISQSRLIEALKSRIPQETGTHQPGTTEAEADSAPAGQDRENEGGRPTYKKEIVEAGLYLLGRNEIDPAKPGKSNWHKVREHVQKQVDTDDARGLSDQTIRRHLKAIFDAHCKTRG